MSELAPLIAKLSDPNPVAREAAATELYRLGRALGETAIHDWRKDADLAALLHGFPTVGVAVPPETFETIREAMGSPPLADVPPDQDAREFELDFPHHVRLDILTTQAPGRGGAIARFLERFGEGIQQVEIPTPNVDRTCELLRTRLGIEPLYPQARSGAGTTRVNFVLARGPEGVKVLIELVETPHAQP